MKRHIAYTVVVLVALAGFVNTGAAASTNIDIDLIKSEPVPLETGAYATVWLRVRNQGSNMAEGVTVTYLPTYPFSVDPDEKTSWDLGTIEPGETYQIRLKVRVDENAVHGNNTLSFRTSNAISSSTLTRKVTVEIRSDDAAVSVDGVEFPAAVAPGTTHDMTVKLRNLADSQLRNIAVSLDLSSDDLPFSPTDTTEKRLRALASGVTENVSFGINVDEDAANGAYKVPLTLTYEDESGTDFEQDLLTGIVVGGTPQVEVGINSQEITQIGTRGTLTLRIVNRGEGTARFLELSIPDGETYELLSPGSVYIGDMEADDYQTTEITLYAAEKPVTLPVELSYKDAQGTFQTETQQVPVKLYTADEYAALGGGTGTPQWLIAVIGVVVIGAGFVYWRRRKKNRS